MNKKIMDTITKKLFNELSEEIRRNEGKYKRLELLYKATDKADVDEFHRKCDNRGPTVTILYGVHNTLFGGYTSQNWSSPKNKRKIKDEKAFIFAMNNYIDAKCNFFPIKKDKTDMAISCAQKYGPTFGAKTSGGYDLQAFKRGKKKTESKDHNNSLYLNGSINVKTAYAMERKNRTKEDCGEGDAKQPNIKSKDINSGRMVVTHLEVYQVTDDECGKNWLEKLEGKDYDETKQKLIEMELPKNIDCYNILLLGAIGAGKSSFINTLSTVFTGNVTQIAPVRKDVNSVTSKLKAYTIKAENGDKMKICIYDIRGFEDRRGYQKELELLLEGKLPIDYQFADVAGEVKVEKKTNSSLNDEIHIVCMVLEGNSNFDSYTAELREHIEYIKRIISIKGLQLVVVATKFDQLCPNVEKNIDHLYKGLKAKKAVTRISDFYGVQRNYVFPVVNYLDEQKPVNTKNQLALLAIHEICTLAEAYLKHHKDIRENIDGWTEREKLLTTRKNDVVLRSIIEELSALENKKLRVLVVGPTGSGKSSFIDSVALALCNTVVNKAVCIGKARANEDSATSTTKNFQLYCMNYVVDGIETKSRVLLGDTPGFQEEDGITKEGVKFIINGNVPDRYNIINGIKETQDEFIREPTPGDKIHCVCLIFDCENILKQLPETMIKLMNDLVGVAVSQDCPLIVILTKCDKVSRVMCKGKYRVYEDAAVRDCKESLIKTFGLKQQEIFPVINYVDENVVDVQKSALLLDAFINILKIGKRRLQEIEEEAGYESKVLYRRNSSFHSE